MSQFDINERSQRKELVKRVIEALESVRRKTEADISKEDFLFSAAGIIVSELRNAVGWPVTKRALEKALSEIEEYEGKRARQKLN